MEKQFAALKIPDSKSDSKLTRASSFSELTSAQQALYEQRHKNDDLINWIKQKSCKLISDRPYQPSPEEDRSKAMQPSNDEHASHSCNMKTLGWKTDDDDCKTRPVSTRNQVERMETEHLESVQKKLSDSADEMAFVASIAPTDTELYLTTSPSKEKLILTQSKSALNENPYKNCTHENEDDKKKDENSQSCQDTKNNMHSFTPKATNPTKRNRCCMSCKVLFLLLLPIFLLLISVMISVRQNMNYKHSTYFANAGIELKRRIYGQDRAIQALNEYLSLDVPSFKVIALVGSTGVGKSYTVEIIRTNFPKTHSIRQYFPPIEMTMSHVGYSFLYPKLIILENLKEHDLTGVVNFLKTYQDTDLTEYITVLAVFNVEHMDDDSKRSLDLNRSIKTIKQAFTDEHINAKIIPYDFLSEDALKKCIMNEAKISGLILSDCQINKIKKNLLEKNAGCKGAYSKVQIIGRQ